MIIAELFDTRKMIIMAGAAALITSLFLFNLYVFAGILLLLLSSELFGLKNTAIVFTMSTYLLVTSDLNEDLRNYLNVFNLILLAALYVYYQGLNSEKLRSLPTGIKLFFFVLLISFLLSSILSEYPVISLTTSLRQAVFMAICFIYFSFIRSAKDIKLFLYTLVFISFVLGTGIVYQLSTEGLSVYYIESMDAVRYSGLYNNPNAVGLFFTTSIPVLFSFIYYKNTANRKAVKFILLSAIIFLLACLLITNSRASILSVFLSLAYILYVFKPKMMLRVIAAGVVIILSLLIVPFIQDYFLFYIRAERIFSNTRTYFWDVAFSIIKDNPLFGAGPGVFEEYIYKYLPVTLGSFFEHQMNMASSGTAHNFFLFRWADLGVAGLITGILLFVLFFRYANVTTGRLKTTGDELYPFAVAIKAVGFGLLIRAFFESTGVMTHGWITRDLPFWILLIILISLFQKSSQIAGSVIKNDR